MYIHNPMLAAVIRIKRLPNITQYLVFGIFADEVEINLINCRVIVGVCKNVEITVCIDLFALIQIYCIRQIVKYKLPFLSMYIKSLDGGVVFVAVVPRLHSYGTGNTLHIIPYIYADAAVTR